MVELGWWGVPIGVVGGAIRVSTPFLFVSLGECITERSGRINLGLEGILIMGAMSGYAVSYTSGNPWLGVLAAGGAGLLLGLLHGLACNLPRVNDIAVGIGLMRFATGLGFFLGKPDVQPRPPTLRAVPLGAWRNPPPVRAALQRCRRFLMGGGRALGPALQSVGITSGYYLFNAAPYVVTLGIMIATCSPRRTLAGAPGELSINR